MTSRGTAKLRNSKALAIDAFVVSVDKRSRVDALTVDGAALVISDPGTGLLSVPAGGAVRAGHDPHDALGPRA